MCSYIPTPKQDAQRAVRLDCPDLLDTPSLGSNLGLKQMAQGQQGHCTCHSAHFNDSCYSKRGLKH